MSQLFNGRTLHKFDPDCHCTEDYCGHDRAVATPAEADVVSSITADGKHMPVIDLDLPCQLVPSATPGHYHLYIDRAIEWHQYTNILAALAQAGIVQDGYFNASVTRGYTSVRVPWKPKDLMAVADVDTEAS